ncbi:MAG: exosome complex protein Rrp4 [Desulfurococcales archaeon]|nr:exosome complex protein Rrp4 [Desulfurococcales archaeon]
MNSGKSIVLPGDLLDGGNIEVRGLGRSYAVYTIGEKVYAAVPGVLEVSDDKKVFTPLENVYIPKPGDIVIGIIVNVSLSYWSVDIRSPYTAVLTAQEFLNRPFNAATETLSTYLAEGDYIIGKISSFDRFKSPFITLKGSDKFGKIVSGKVVEIKPSRVPRVIGRKKSMLNMMMEETGCDITVGVNGVIHVKCKEPVVEDLVALAIKKIEIEAHTSGLTDRIKSFLREKLSELQGKEVS